MNTISGDIMARATLATEAEMAESRCLLVGPFPDWARVEREAVRRGWTVRTVESGAEAFRTLQEDDSVIAVLLPALLRDGPADNLLLRARGAGTRADFVVIAGGAGREERASLLAEGADEVFEPPVDHDRLLGKLDRLRDRRRLIDDLGIVVRNPTMLELFERVLRIAPLKVTALITGESGTGKELLAQAIHHASDRRDGPFVAVNVGALPETLLESELFGHERGAFTGADARRLGRFELAHGGTLFLDEIGEMSLASQVNLLRVLEEEQFLRVGGSQRIAVDVRVVAATNRDLEEMVREGKFRRDLFYRIKVVSLEVPPLRERQDEIPVLAKAFAVRAASRHGLSFPGFAKDALEALVDYEWPGNVRELRNLVDGLVALRPETQVRASDLPPFVTRPHGSRLLPALPADRTAAEREFVIQSLLALRAEVAALRELILTGRAGTGALSYVPAAGVGPVYPAAPIRVEESDSGGLALKDVERRTIERALRESRGNRRLAAHALGMSERTLYRRLKEYGFGDDAG
jgi:DNA-binding NtrC family response regulator